MLFRSARSVLRESPILILDEPLANLDMKTLDVVEDFIMKLSDRTLIIISHIFNEKEMTKFDGVLEL